MSKLISFLLILLATATFAQQKRVEAKLSAIEEDGLYKVQIPHNLRSYAKQDMNDFRIWDSNNNQVPYFIHKDDKESRISNFSEFTIISRSNIPDTLSSYVFSNPNEKIQKAVLFIANYQGSKSFNLQGSNDQKEWFGIVNNKQLHNLNSSKKTSIYKIINFPLCSYQFLKIVFNDKNSLPINLLSIGTATTEITKSAMEEIPVKSTKISELSTSKQTAIHVEFEHPEIINELHFNIASPELFNRRARVYVLNEREVNHEIGTYQKEITSFVIHSEKDNHFSIPSFFGKELYIEIENQDNPKLSISSLNFFQTTWYAVANLKKGVNYTASAGDVKLKAPKYDISYFRKNMSESLPKLSIIDVKLIEGKVKEKANVPLWQKSWFMWLCIGFAAVIIAYFSTNLIKDLKK
jgi:hypothetical protein